MDNRAQLRNFCERLATQTGTPDANADGWAKAFDKTFPALLKTAWDTQFSKRDKLVFVVCGFVSTWINRNILRSKAIVGRISCSLKLEEMPLSDCREFWGSVWLKQKGK